MTHPVRLLEGHMGFQSVDRGSNPLRDTGGEDGAEPMPSVVVELTVSNPYSLPQPPTSHSSIGRTHGFSIRGQGFESPMRY